MRSLEFKEFYSCFYNEDCKLFSLQFAQEKRSKFDYKYYIGGRLP